MPNIVHEARKAHRIMKNLVYHINKYSKDSLYIGKNVMFWWSTQKRDTILPKHYNFKYSYFSTPEAMVKLKENITEFPEDVDLHNLGPLVKEFESIDMKLLSSEDNYRKYQLLIFQDYLGRVSFSSPEKLKNFLCNLI